jgi:DnaJ-class molecular chaperone
MAEASGTTGGGSAPRNPGDQAAPDASQTGMVPCPTCHGSGKSGEAECATCGGTGQVVQIVGDA